MRNRWTIIFFFIIPWPCFFSLNNEGLFLLDFRSGVEIDPYGVFDNWNANDDDPCKWSGVWCANGKVEMLDLKEQSLAGVLAPQLGKLSELRALILHGNNFTGTIPEELTGLAKLELLDLRQNNLSGKIPTDVREMLSLKCFLISDNNFQVSKELEYVNRKVGYRFKSKVRSSHLNGDGHGDYISNDIVEFYIEQNVHTFRRHLLQETTNLAAFSVSSSSPPQVNVKVPSIGSGLFLALPNSEKNTKSQPSQPSSPPLSLHSSDKEPTTSSPSSRKGLGVWIYVLIMFGAILILALVTFLFFMLRRKGSGAIGPWKTGLSGQLQNAFTAGVPKLSRAELEAACEDFSNIICTVKNYTMFKGTLSSGVEIAVISTAAKSSTEWSKSLELCFRKKIDMLSRINHKNFINLIGYCEESQPFMRMMVFEYAPEGTLYNHLHVKDYEHLDWSARMRVIMGIAYCLRHMHNEVKPPIALQALHSNAIFVTIDFAAKIADVSIFSEVPAKQWMSSEDTKGLMEASPPDPESNVYSFGILMLEIISGKFPYSEEGSIVDWAAQYFRGERDIKEIVDSTVKLSEENDVQRICKIVQDCLQHDPAKRHTMQEVTSALREVLEITPEMASPSGSALRWAELEILSTDPS